MNPEVKDYWSTYFCRASIWADEMTPEMYNSAVNVMAGTHPGPLFTSLGKPIFVNSTKHDVSSVKEYIDNPEQCTKNPYTYHAMRQVPILDLKWSEIILEKRTKDYTKLKQMLEESVNEIKAPKKCYDVGEIFSLMKDIVSME